MARAHPGAAALPALGRSGPGPRRGAARGGHRAARPRVGAPAGWPAVRAPTLPLVRAVQAHAEALAATTEGRVAQAEEAWARASLLERESRTRRARLGPGGRARASGLGRRAPPVALRPASGAHRPRPHRLRPPRAAAPSRRSASRRATRSTPSPVGRCRQPFSAYLAESREVRSTAAPFGRRLSFRLEPLGGGASRVQFDDGSPDPFHAARGDLLAFLYTEGPVLRGVTNLSTGRTLWRRRTGPVLDRHPGLRRGRARAGGAPDLPRRGPAANAGWAGPPSRVTTGAHRGWSGGWTHRPRSRAWARRATGRAGAEDRVTTDGGAEETVGRWRTSPARRFPGAPRGAARARHRGAPLVRHPGGAPLPSRRDRSSVRPRRFAWRSSAAAPSAPPSSGARW